MKYEEPMINIIYLEDKSIYTLNVEVSGIGGSSPASSGKDILNGK